MIQTKKGGEENGDKEGSCEEGGDEDHCEEDVDEEKIEPDRQEGDTGVSPSRYGERRYPLFIARRYFFLISGGCEGESRCYE